MATRKLRLWGGTVNGRSNKCRVVAAYCNIDIEVPPFVMGATNKTPAYLAMNPCGKVPVLETPDGPLYESQAIMRYLASQEVNPLYPSDPLARAQVDAWMDNAQQEIDPINQGWLYPLLGYKAHDAAAEKAAHAAAKAYFAALESHLGPRTWLVGVTMTLADLSVAFTLRGLYHTALDAAYFKPYPAVARWLATVYGQPTVARIAGVAALLAKGKVYDAKEAAAAMAARVAAAAARDAAAATAAGWTAPKVRATFLEFFASRSHMMVPSSPVVPVSDPTLLFANSGMNQFKPLFLGKADPKSYLASLKRAANTQKCIRAGGKHNDLDDVGKDTYHHTFFEMLGNWSFGDYFKKEAIHWAWELLTVVYGLPKDRLYATYFKGDEKLGLPADTEARDIWLTLMEPHRVLPFGPKENFWEMGDTGPCGPCTEIHCDRIGGRDASALVNYDDPTCIEIWNLVFIQFNREPDGSLRPLPNKHVDTGMGFERITSILQDKPSNYDTDVFMPIFGFIQQLTGAAPYGGRLGPDDVGSRDMAYRVVADHIRTLSFAITDGSQPGNEGREYVLRRILRRAVRYGRENLGGKEGFFSKLVPLFIDFMAPHFPELRAKQDHVQAIIADEEASFSRTLLKGIERFGRIAADLPAGGKMAGQEAFELWDTFGFPVDLTQLMAQERGYDVDMAGFTSAMSEAVERSRAARKGAAGAELRLEAEQTAALAKAGVKPTADAAKYVWHVPVKATIKALLTPTGFVQSTAGLGEGTDLGVFLDATPFYAEQGGQIYDTGALVAVSAGKTRFDVRGVTVAAGFVLHAGAASSAVQLKVGDAVSAEVDYVRRAKIAPNHTCTHILNFGLQSVLGGHVDQKGSLVDESRLRFDFSAPKPLEPAQIAAVEGIVRAQIAASLAVHAMEVPLAQAKGIRGLRAVFGEVYPDPVRVVSVGVPVTDLIKSPNDPRWAAASIEFCGGTHLSNTREAGAFALVSEEGVAKGVRRIVGLTGAAAEAATTEGARLAARLAAADKMAPGAPLDKEVADFKATVEAAVISAATKAELRSGVDSLIRRILAAAKDAGKAHRDAAVAAAAAAAKAALAAGKTFAVATVAVGLDSAALMAAVTDSLKASPGVAMLLLSADVGADKVAAYAGVPPAMAPRLDVLQWLLAALGPCGGKGGGGKNGLAQGQGGHAAKVGEAHRAAVAFAERAR